MTLSRNVLAGLVSSSWSTIVGIAVVPIYLRYLGVEAYGVIGFFATTQAFLQVFDLGLAPTVNREVARCAAGGDIRQASRLLHTLAVVYWVTAVILGGAVVLAAPAIATGWLQARQLPPDTVSRAVALMGLTVACRWPIALYIGAVMGAERIVLASGLAMAMTTLSSVGAVAVIAFVSPTLEALFIWQAGAGLLHAIVARWAAWRTVPRFAETRFDSAELRRVWRFSAGMSGIALFTLAFSQMDKVILSRVLTLGDFGRYMLATTVASGLYVLVTPFMNALYPRFSALVVSETGQLATLYRHSTRLIGTVLFPAAALLFFWSGDVVRVWTRDGEMASRVAPVVSLLVLATALHGVMTMPYVLQLANGMTSLSLRVNTILIVILVPLEIVLALSYGAIGGAMAWLAFHVFNLVLGTGMTHRYLLRGLATRWVFNDVAVPLLVSFSVAAMGHEAVQASALPPWARLACGGAIALLAFALCLVVFPALRSTVVENLPWVKRVSAS